ncbi:MAG TPA: restriction endonuclease subunit S [Longimicrobium sp.]|jgi:type I restriction enzyme S subunit|uniref:restriction endonuclease subunit S n=1 Tax=Longimicrobium sp. TaxID=2029185 RepID=UPI002ED86769
MSVELGVLPLERVAVITMGQSPPSSVVNESGNGVPFLQGNAEFGSQYPQARLYCTRPGKLAQRDDTLISVRAPVGAINRADKEYCIGRGLAAVRFTAADPQYGFHVLGLAPRQLRRVSQGTTFEAVGKKELSQVRLFIPTRSEQCRIAEVLDTADEAMRDAEALIAKLKRLKHGLLHDLLTRGLDENGELRDPIEQPEQFKESPLGRLPQDWQVQPVIALLAEVNPAMRSGPFGSELLASELRGHGIPLLGIDNVYPEKFVPKFTRFVGESKYLTLSRYAVRPNDVMITIMGTVGRSCLVPGTIGTALSSKHVWTLTFDEARYSPMLASLQINYAPWVVRQFRRDEQGGIMSAIRADTLRTLLLPVPPRMEQQRIETVLSEVNARIRAEEAYRNKLQLLKSGLMQDLLTGYVRVPATEREPELIEAGA